MNPALSVIFFTVVSGCGYGMLFLLGAIVLCAPHVLARAEALLVFASGALFAAAGLLSSMLHLGQPQRAWRAFSQWRSSWLSREGVVATLSFVPLLALGAAIGMDASDTAIRALGALLMPFAATTVFCTAKIYTTLKTIPAWHNASVLPGYFAFALLGGAAWLLALHELFDNAAANAGLSWFVLGLAILAYGLKREYWKNIDTAPPSATPESATGLGRFGRVRSIEAPHTEGNYLAHEMGFRIARKHAARLRKICLMLIGPVPAAFAAGTMLTATQWSGAMPLFAMLAALCVSAGIFVERWLFFAQARHVVMLYYGAERA